MIVWTCEGEAKCNTCPFLHIFCRPSFNHEFFTTLVYSVFIWFDLFCYLTWCSNKMVFWVSLYFDKQVKRAVRKRSHMLIIGVCSFLWNVRCMHVGSFPWRWNVINVHKFSMGSKRSITIITMHT
jgi:hypothetical protein